MSSEPPLPDVMEAIRETAPPTLRDLLAQVHGGSLTAHSSLTHFHCEYLSIWVTPTDIGDFFADQDRLLEFNELLVQSTLRIGQICASLGKPLKGRNRPVYRTACLGCSSSYDNNSHSHTGCPGSMVLPKKERAAGDHLHVAVCLLSIAIALLTWNTSSGDERVIVGQHNLLDIFIQADLEGHVSSVSRIASGRLPLLPILVGVLDNCTIVFPRCAHLSISLFSLILAKSPSTALSVLDPEPFIDALSSYMGNIFPRISNAPCRVEEYFGILELLNILPTLFYIGDWKESARVLMKSNMPAFVASITINVLHSVVAAEGGVKDEGISMNAPKEELTVEFPELMSARVYVDVLYGEVGREVMCQTPYTFLVVALLEILTRWECHCDIPVKQGVIPCCEGEDITIAGAVLEYLPRLQTLVAGQKAVEFVLPIAQGFAEGAVLRQPKEGLLRGPMLHASMKCALPGCMIAGPALLHCSGGCRRLARYCSAEHQVRECDLFNDNTIILYMLNVTPHILLFSSCQKLHWKQHKAFCKRQEGSKTK